MLGMFNTDPAQAAASFQRLAGLDPEVVCCGHVEPITTSAAALPYAAAEHLDHGQ
jgi:glyoxylase-like metal-dependent hydrolase (beta-lactamase superfamily II)